MDFETGYEKLLERYGNGDIGRRTFLTVLGRVAAACGVVGPLTAGCSPGGSGENNVRFDGFGGVAQATFGKRVFEPFTAKTGRGVDQGSYANSDEFLTKIQAEGLSSFNYWDCGSEFEAQRFLNRGYLAVLDETKIPRLASLMPKAVDSYRLADGKLVGVPCTLTGLLIGYNKDKIDRAEVEARGVDILLDKKFKGVLAGEDNWIKRIWYAALQSGQDPNDIRDMDAVWDKIRASREVVLKYWTTGAEQMQLLASGNALLSDAWFMRIHALRQQELPIDGFQAKGLYVGVAALAALKGAPLEPFYEMMDIMLRPEVLSAIAIDRGAPPALDASRFNVPDEIKAMPGFDPTGELRDINIMKPSYWAEHANDWSANYRRIMARG